MSCDDNPMYADFWPLVSRVWKEKLNIEPVLAYFGNKPMSEKYGTVIQFEPFYDVPISLQTLWVRYYYPSLEPDDVWIISDIDMFPISSYYFIDKIRDIDPEKYVHLNPCIESYGLIPSCYHVAKGSKFKEVFDLPDNWKESLDLVATSGFGRTINGNALWFADEEYATHKINNFKKKDDIIFLPREGGQNGYRIDRDRWKYDETLAKDGIYFDSHSIRPYSKYKNEIDKLVSLILWKK
jgi:hypothetical protein